MEHGERMDFKKFFNSASENKKNETPEETDREVELRTTADSINSTTADKEAEDHDCPSCQDSEWWIDIHFGGPHCSSCKPPPARGMVRESFFYDDHGNRWEVTAGKKSEVWRKV